MNVKIDSGANNVTSKIAEYKYMKSHSRSGILELLPLSATYVISTEDSSYTDAVYPILSLQSNMIFT
jgi:hypothetical protein